MLTQAELKSKLIYFPEEGYFIRLPLGNVTGFNRNGYVIIGIKNREYRAHRLAWLYVYGAMPNNFIDHINGDKTDNRIANLREATKSQNGFNVGIKSTNKSGYKNVSWNKEKMKWKVALRVNGKQKHMGYFDDLEFAGMVASESRDKFHKEFAKL
jgi:hypothetical protein